MTTAADDLTASCTTAGQCRHRSLAQPPPSFLLHHLPSPYPVRPCMSLGSHLQHRRRPPSTGSHPIILLLPFLAAPEPEHSLHLLRAVAAVAMSPATDGVDSILSPDRPVPYPSLHLPAPPSSSTSSVFLTAASPNHVHPSLFRHYEPHWPLPSSKTSPTKPAGPHHLLLLSLPLPFAEHLPTCLTSVLFGAIPTTYRCCRRPITGWPDAASVRPPQVLVACPSPVLVEVSLGQTVAMSTVAQPSLSSPFLEPALSIHHYD